MRSSDTLQILKRHVLDNLSVVSSLTEENGKIRSKRLIQHMLGLKHEDKEVQILMDVLMSHALKAESLTPMGFLNFINKFVDIDCETPSRIRTKYDIVDLIKKRKFEKSVENIIIECLNYSSIDTSISIKKSNNDVTHIELIKDQVFEVKSLLKKSNLDISKPKVVCIDGYIENITEIHHLMTILSEKRENCIAFVRGMSEDVLHTLKVNIDRSTVLLYPFLVPFDVENVNTIVDISVTAGTDIITSLKGDLISSVKYENLGSLESCRVYGDNLRLKPRDVNLNAIQNHVNNLRRKIDERRDLEDILGKRIKSLNSSRIEISIPDDINFYSRSQQLDEGIRLISSIINNTYDPSGVAEKIYNSFINSTHNTQTFLL